MTVTYTNRKGATYTLCRSTTKTGKPRYIFVRDPSGRDVVAEMPTGWEIRESVNGIVSLAKKRPQQILPEEVAAIEDAIEKHPKSYNYRADVKPDRILIYERIGPDAEAMLETFQAFGFEAANLKEAIHEEIQSYGQFTPVMRFILNEAEKRDFRAERWCYRGRIDDWIFLTTGKIDYLAQKLIPTLGTDEFFELY